MKNKLRKSTWILTGVVLLFITLNFDFKNVKQENHQHLMKESVMTMKKQTKIIGKAYGIENCACLRFGIDVKHLNRSTSTSKVIESTCSDFATQRGANQNVFSYSVYNPEGDKQWNPNSTNFRKYLGLMYGRVKFIENHFPGWLVRIYHNISASDTYASKYICRMYCSFDIVDLCNVNKLPTLGNLFKKEPIGRTWRFAVMGDPLVSIFMNRDTDSFILDREVVAVNEFLKSTFTYHVIKDHPNHAATILAGLWGGWNNNSKLMADLRDQMFNHPASWHRNFDQELLAKIVWPLIKRDTLQHASYNCRLINFGRTVAFSTKRDAGYYVGWGPFKLTERQAVLKNKCPPLCRHPNHPDWKHC